MSSGIAERIEPQAAQDTVVDSDFHLEITPDHLLPYISNDEIAGKVERWGISHSAVNGWNASYGHELESGTTTHGTAYDTEEILEEGEQLALDKIIATPGVTVKFPASRYPALKNELTRAYNDYVVDNVIDPENDVYATLLIQHWDSRAALEEIERLGDHDGFVGVQSFYGPHNLLGETEFDPVWDVATSLNLPLVLHGIGFHSSTTLQGNSKHSYLEAFGLEWPFDAMANVANMVCGGIFDKFPEMKVVIQEGGIGWISFLAHRLDEMYQTNAEEVRLTERLVELDQVYLDKMPSEYIFENFRYTTQPISLPKAPKYAEAMLDMCRADSTLLFSTDFPHNTIDVVNWVYENPAIDDSRRHRILSGNAEDVFPL